MGANGGSGQVLLSAFEMSSGSEAGVDEEFEVEAERKLWFGEVQGAVKADQGLDGGMEFGVTLFTQPIAAGTFEGETDPASPWLHGAEHVT